MCIDITRQKIEKKIVMTVIFSPKPPAVDLFTFDPSAINLPDQDAKAVLTAINSGSESQLDMSLTDDTPALMLTGEYAHPDEESAFMRPDSAFSSLTTTNEQASKLSHSCLSPEELRAIQAPLTPGKDTTKENGGHTTTDLEHLSPEDEQPESYGSGSVGGSAILSQERLRPTGHKHEGRFHISISLRREYPAVADACESSPAPVSQGHANAERLGNPADTGINPDQNDETNHSLTTRTVLSNQPQKIGDSPTGAGSRDNADRVVMGQNSHGDSGAPGDEDFSNDGESKDSHSPSQNQKPSSLSANAGPTKSGSQFQETLGPSTTASDSPSESVSDDIKGFGFKEVTDSSSLEKSSKMTAAQKTAQTTTLHNAQDQIAMAVKPNVQTGKTEINLSLRPDHLGRVKISLDISTDGKTYVVVAAERPETRELLQQDSSRLAELLNQGEDGDLDVTEDNISYNDFSDRDHESHGSETDHAPASDHHTAHKGSDAQTRLEAEIGPKIQTRATAHLDGLWTIQA